MKKIFLSLLMGFFCMVFARTAQAGFEMSQSQEATIENASSGKITQKQTQTMRVYRNYDDYDYHQPRYNPGPARRYYQRANQPIDSTYVGGENAWISWNFRGGVCRVYYSELSTSYYKYSAETDCNNGGMNIGGLNSGTTYKFRVEQR